MKLVLNVALDRVVDLLPQLTSAAPLEIMTDELSLQGLEQLMQLRPKAVRLLLGPRSLRASLAGSAGDLRQRNALRQRSLATSALSLLNASEVRQANLPLSQAAFVTPEFAVFGNCSLTSAGLGLAPEERVGFVQCTESAAEAAAVAQIFASQWAMARSGGEASDELFGILGETAASTPAAAIYAHALRSLFEDLNEGTQEDRIVDPATGIRETQIWSKLYRFQRDGVIGAIDKLQRFGGCILADSVGLGKTFEALAVIKYFELRNARVLVLAPKRLRENWTLWTQNDLRNDLAADRFAFDVLNHTDLSRDKGFSGEIDLSHVNLGNYELVVIDESHNFRNRPAGKGERESRYDKLMNAVVRAGVRTKVLMLSATPVNNRLNDLKNQIAFATEGNDAALAGHGIASIGTTIRLAQSQFRRWQELPDERRNPARLLEMLGFDYFRLLDLLTIARSRKHVERYYGVEEMGAFPEKMEPLNIYADVDLSDEFPPIGEVNSEIRRLKLAAYAPLRYVMDDRRPAYDRRYNQATGSGESVFRQLDREESLVSLMRVNLLKRMESSVHAFALTIERQLEEIERLIARIENHDESIDMPPIDELEEDDPLFEELGVGRNVKVLLGDADLVRWRQDLAEDRERLQRLLARARTVTPQRDAKLARLKELIADKLNQPFNPGNRKLLIFTAFSDTAEYLYEALAEDYPGNMALITGSSRNRTTHPRLRTDLASLLTAFSPRSRSRPEALADEEELDLIIATDCISEGQNLQDCDCVVNEAAGSGGAQGPPATCPDRAGPPAPGRRAARSRVGARQ